MNQIEQLLFDLDAENLPHTQQEALSKHTTFCIGGPAAVFCEPAEDNQLADTIALCRKHNVRFYLLGNGSNTLFCDAGFPGAVISTMKIDATPSLRQTEQGMQIEIGAGAKLIALCRIAQENSLAGLEFAYGIPGTVGGAVYMNAGAYGGEMKDVLQSVSYLDENGILCTAPAEKLALGYRTSIFEKHPGWCIVRARLLLQSGDKQQITDTMQELLQRRKDKQPLDMPSAGSTFKRPQGAFAGKLIEDCGLRGMKVGDAQISEKHCGFVVNCGNATCADVIALTDKVNEIVQRKTGYTLEREIRIVE